MGMDGLYRPSQHLAFTDTVGHLDAAARLEAQQKRANLVSSYEAVEGVAEHDKEDPQGKKGKKRQALTEQNTVFEDDMMALLNEKFGLSLDPNGIYHLYYNDLQDCFELQDLSTKRVLLRLSSDEFLPIMQQVKERSGMMTDRSA